MSELSHKAQAMLDAYRSSHLSINNLAAALRAAADQVVPANGSRKNNEIRDELLIIVKQLEAQ